VAKCGGENVPTVKCGGKLWSFNAEFGVGLALESGFRLLQPLTLLVTGSPEPAIHQLPLTDHSAAATLVVTPPLLLVLQSGIQCLTICAVQLLDQASFDGI